MNTFAIDNLDGFSYLVYDVSESDQVDEFTLGMLVNNKMNGFAPVIVNQIDEKRQLRYNITGLIPLYQYAAGVMNRVKFLNIVKSIIDTVIYAEQYMIDQKAFQFDMSTVYVNPVTNDISLICFPIENGTTTNPAMFFQNLICYDRVIYDQNEDLNYVSTVLNYIQNNSFSFKDLKQIVLSLMPQISEDTNLAARRQEAEEKRSRLQNIVDKNVQDMNAAAAKVFNKIEQKMDDNILAEAVKAEKDVGFEIPGGGSFGAAPAKEKKFSLFKKDENKEKEKADKKAEKLAEKERKKAQKEYDKEQKRLAKEAKKKKANPIADIDIPEEVYEGSKSDVDDSFGIGLMNLQDPFANLNAGQNVAQNPFANGMSDQGVSQNPFNTPQVQTPPDFSGQQPVQPFVISGQQPIQPVESPVQPIQEPLMPEFKPIQEINMIKEPEPAASTPIQDVVFPQNDDFVDLEATVLFDEGTVLLDEGTVLLDEGTVLLEENKPEIRPTLTRCSTEEVVEIDKDMFKIGHRKAYADYYIGDNPTISRAHAIILKKEDGKYYIMDTNSKNHTYLNEERLDPEVEYPLESGVVIRMANEEFVYTLEEE